MYGKIFSRVQDALDAARLIEMWTTTDSFEEIVDNPKLESAYMHQLIRIGEALRIVRDYDPEFAEVIPDVHKWIGLRHRIIHDYRELDIDLLWLTATQEIPAFISSPEEVLSG